MDIDILENDIEHSKLLPIVTRALHTTTHKFGLPKFGITYHNSAPKNSAFR